MEILINVKAFENYFYGLKIFDLFFPFVSD